MAILPSSSGIQGWDTVKGSRIDSWQTGMHEVTATFLGEGANALAAGTDRALVLWDVTQEKELDRITIDTVPTCISVSGDRVAVGMANGCVALVKVK